MRRSYGTNKLLLLFFIKQLKIESLCGRKKFVSMSIGQLLISKGMYTIYQIYHFSSERNDIKFSLRNVSLIKLIFKKLILNKRLVLE